MVIGVFHNKNTSVNRLKYTLDFISNHPLCPGNIRFFCNLGHTCDLNIGYGISENTSFVIPAQNLFFSSVKKDVSGLNCNEYEYNGASLFSVENIPRKEKKPLLAKGAFGFDILESIFFHISRYEEYHCGSESRNEWDNMKEDQQFLVRHQLEKRPVVDLLIHAFLKAIGIDVQSRKTEITLTHDIDHIRKFYGIFSLIKKQISFIVKGKSKSLGKQYHQYKKGVDPFDSFSWMLIKDPSFEKYIFYLIGGNSRYDTPTDPKEPIFVNSIRLAKERGYEIGVHPSYNTWTNKEAIEKEKQQLEQIIGTEISVSRQHYLHFHFPKTIKALSEAGIKEDMSIGFNSRIGFRCGTGFPYKMYDLEADQITEIIQRPLVFMDSSLFNESQYDAEKMYNIAKSFLEKTRENTHITFNFHNSRFDDAEMNDLPLPDIYQNVVNRLWI